MTPIDLSAGSPGWLQLEPEPRPPFYEQRVQLHWAAQCIAAFGEALVEPQSDASHTSMRWFEAQRALLGRPGAKELRLGLRLAAPALFLMDAEGAIRSELPIVDQSLESCLGWVSQEASTILGDTLPRPLVLPEYAMPQHPVGAGASFSAPDEAACEQIARWYANASSILEEIRAQLPGAGPVRCWPHHFDLAMLWMMDPEESNPEKARSIGCGMMLGDDSVDEPYFYCNPWPRPNAEKLPPLEGSGSWHVKGWVGALLRSGELKSKAAGQATQTATFFASAIAANRKVLGSRERH